MDYIVTEPGLTSLTTAQVLTSAQYANCVAQFQSDAFSVVPYSKAALAAAKAVLRQENQQRAARRAARARAASHRAAVANAYPATFQDLVAATLTSSTATAAEKKEAARVLNMLRFR